MSDKNILRPPIKEIKITLDKLDSGTITPQRVENSVRIITNQPVNMDHVFTFFKDEYRIAVERPINTIFLPSITFSTIQGLEEVEWVFEKENNRDDVYNILIDDYTTELNVSLR